MSLVNEPILKDVETTSYTPRQQTIQGVPNVSKNTPLQVYVEVSYSESRRKEMLKEHETNCTLLISLLKDHLKDQGALDIKSWVPKNKDRFADIVLEFKVKDEAKLEGLAHVLDHVGGSSIGKTEYFISDD